MTTFAGREMTLREIYEDHSVDTPYIEKNYREILNALENEEQIEVYSLRGKRRKGTYPDHVRIKFPGGGSYSH